jgi:hypothetical protein
VSGVGLLVRSVPFLSLSFAESVLTTRNNSFRILVTSENSGLVETINDAVSVHSIKKDAYARRAEDGTQVFTTFTLYDHFVNVRFLRLSLPSFADETDAEVNRPTVLPTRASSARRRRRSFSPLRRTRSSLTSFS